MSIIALVSFGTILVVASAVFMTVFMGLWVYHDAKERNIENPALWVLLSVLLSNFIGLIIYLVVRSTQGRRHACPSCGFMLSESNGFCSRCGVQQPPVSAYPPEQGKTKKYFKCFIASIIVLGATVVLLIVLSIVNATAHAHGNSFMPGYRYSGISISPSHQARNLKAETKGQRSEMIFDQLNGNYQLTNISIKDGESILLDVEYGAEGGALQVEIRGNRQTIPLTQGQNEPTLSEGSYTVYVCAQDATFGSVVVKLSDDI